VAVLPAAGVKFTVVDSVLPSVMVARKLFYNNSAWDTVSDADAIDPTKSPLMAGGGTCTYANYASYSKGINGLVYDVKLGSGQRAPLQSDFVFRNIGKWGTVAPGAVQTPTGFALSTYTSGPDTITRCAITFADNSIADTWLQVDIGTGFGLALAETHYWGNAMGETQNEATFTTMVVNALDVSKVKANYGVPGTAVVSAICDFDKNKSINALDVSYCKSKYSSPPSAAVQLITR